MFLFITFGALHQGWNVRTASSGAVSTLVRSVETIFLVATWVRPPRDRCRYQLTASRITSRALQRSRVYSQVCRPRYFRVPTAPQY